MLLPELGHDQISHKQVIELHVELSNFVSAISLQKDNNTQDQQCFVGKCSNVPAL